MTNTKSWTAKALTIMLALLLCGGPQLLEAQSAPSQQPQLPANPAVRWRHGESGAGAAGAGSASCPSGSPSDSCSDSIAARDRPGGPGTANPD